MCTVASAPGAASVRVWETMSRGWRPRGERPPPEGASVAYAHVWQTRLLRCASAPPRPRIIEAHNDYRSRVAVKNFVASPEADGYWWLVSVLGAVRLSEPAPQPQVHCDGQHVQPNGRCVVKVL